MKIDYSSKLQHRCVLKLLSAGAVAAAMLLIPLGCALNVNKPLSESTAITFSEPGFRLEPESSFYWRSDLIYIYDDPGKKPKNIQPFLKQETQDYLEEKNYQFPNDKRLAKFGLIAVIVIDDDITAQDIMNQFGLKPSFKATRLYKKGTIVIAILDAASEKIVWRGSLEANISLNLPTEVRRSRVREMTHKLLEKVPAGRS